MKMSKVTLSAKLRWLFVVCNIIMFAPTYAQEKSISGAYVVDPAVSVPANAYVTFSTVYNGRRYYLGVDTVKAKAATPTYEIMQYDSATYATMWVAGPLWSPTGDVLTNKDYTRTIKSVWMDERVDQDLYLALGDPETPGAPYNTLVLSETGAMWHTAKDVKAVGQYIQGYMYYYSEESGINVYRYLHYDPMYGFGRLDEERPEASQRISVWDRTIGEDLVFKTDPSAYSFGLDQRHDTTRIPFTSQVFYYPHVDRFRSRYARVDVYTSEPEVVDNQSTLVGTYHMNGYYEWKSNPRGEGTYSGHSLMPMYAWTGALDGESKPVFAWRDSTVMWVSDTKNQLIANMWHDTIFMIGKSPIDRPECRVLRKTGSGAPTEGDYTDHADWLYIHLFLDAQGGGSQNHYVDSILLTRQTFHTEHKVTLTTNSSPSDKVFPYIYDGKDKDGAAIGERNTQLFTITGEYRVTNDTLYANGVYANGGIGDLQELDIRNATGTTIDAVKYDQLDVVAYEAGTTTPCSWLTVTVNPSCKDQIQVVCSNYDPGVNANRIAEIHYTYRYSEGNTEATRVIWVTQRSRATEQAGTSVELYSFNHKGEQENGLQATHERIDTIYAIPEENMTLPIHRDHWGYYRWFIYDGDYKNKDLEYSSMWTYARKPQNRIPTAFMPINHTDDPSSRGQWDVIRDINAGNDNFEPAATKEHFVVGSPTRFPAVQYPGSTGDSKTGKVACDVSAYYDIATSSAAGTAYVNKNLTSLTEPTLSYRQVLNVKPAKVSAEVMKEHLYKGDGGDKNTKWMEDYTVIVPAGREFTLQQKYPVMKGNADIDEANLNYVYYLNGTASKEGTDEGYTSATYKQNRSYNRVGISKTVGKVLKLRPITVSQLTGLSAYSSIGSLILVNPHTGTGIIIGDDGGTIPTRRKLGSFTTESDLRDTLEARLNRGAISSSAYYLTFEHYHRDRIGRDDDYLRFTHDGKELKNLFTFVSGWDSWWYYSLSWYSGGTGEADLTLASYSGSNTNLPTGIPAGCLMTIYSDYSSNRGYFKAEETNIRGYKYPMYPDNSVNSSTTTAEHAWLVYQVYEESGSTHVETPRWEKWNGSAWAEVERATDTDADGYEMIADGALSIGDAVHTTANETIQYRLRTEHFQIARFTVITRNPNSEGPRNDKAIIPEEEIQNNYTTLFSLGLENFPAPADPSQVTAYNHHLPWDFTELSYHYPQSAVPSNRRVDGTSMLPMRGEYCFLNKFVDPTDASHVINARDKYFMCIQTSQKPVTIFNFDYSGLTCSDQQIYLTFDLCNPVNNGYEPQITAELQGYDETEKQWEVIYRYKTGELKYNSTGSATRDWYQTVLPIARSAVSGYKYFRCSAMLNPSSENNAYILIDRLRFIEKSRPFSVFQNKSTCVKDDSVYVQIRLDYQADTALFKEGRLIAYQFQMWKDTANGGAGGYIPMRASMSNGAGGYIQLTDETDPTAEVYPGYIKDAFTAKESVEHPDLKSYKGYDYGYVLVPEYTYDPSKSGKTDPSRETSDLREALIDQALTKLSITGSDATTRKNNFLDETGNVKELNEVISQSDLDFGDYSTPHIKSFVNEGTESKPHWVIYLATRLPVEVTQNRTFRIAMTTMKGLSDKPTFTDESCATFRILNVKQATSLLLDGASWPNHPRADLKSANDSPVDAEHTLLPANETYRASVLLDIPAIGGHETTNEVCKFDLLHVPDSIRPNTDAGNRAFRNRFGYDRTTVMDAFVTFRNNDPDNKMRNESDWSKIEPIDFAWSEANPKVLSERARQRYNIINSLITSGVLELSLDYRDIYMGDRMDSYFYLIPIPASGWFTWVGASSAGTDTVVQATICNDTLWLELHSEEPDYKLRYGYDSRVGDTYIVPTIRSSLTDATTGLSVRVAKIWSDNSNKVIIGWQSTQLIGSNDPDWTGSEVFKYQQDKTVIGSQPQEVSYYTDGSIVTFTPVTGGVNTITLKAGYWYRFESEFYSAVPNATYTSDAVSGTSAGHSQFILAVAPDTVRWTPEHAHKANYWNDDHNWTPVMYNTPADGFKATVPMGDTKVIIPEVSEGLLPIASDVVEDNVDTLHYGYKKNTCSKILFKPRSQILGQEKLTYNNAFVDVLIKTGNWQTFSPALEDVYAGDMYIPFATTYDKDNPASGASIDTVDFAPKPFPYTSTCPSSYNPRVYPFAFYQGFYNSSVDVAYYNTDEDEMPVATTKQQSKSVIDWVRTNALDARYEPGKACVLKGYDAYDKDGREIVIRLPKQETTYYGYGENPKGSGSYATSQSVSVSRVSGLHNLAYDQYATGFNETDGLSYTLTNQLESNIFFFGNPTMSLIDVYQLCEDNATQLQKSEGKHQFTAYQLADSLNSTYTARTIDGPGQYFVAPQRAVGLIANAANTTAKSLTLKLTPKALVAITGDGIIVSHDEVKADAPQRRTPYTVHSTPSTEKRLYIMASNETSKGTYKAYLTLGEQTDASRGFIYGEDAKSLSSGSNYYNSGSYSTPLNLYTIADNEALMQDIRDTLSGVPVVISTLDSVWNSKGQRVSSKYAFDEYTLLSFSMNGAWDKPLYLYDAVTGDSLLIRNGLQVAVRTPLSDQLRYFINGGKRTTTTTDQPGVATGLETVNGENTLTSNLSPLTFIYDLLGRHVMTLTEHDLISNIQLPTGVYILQRGDKTERMVIR